MLVLRHGTLPWFADISGYLNVLPNVRLTIRIFGIVLDFTLPLSSIALDRIVFS